MGRAKLTMELIQKEKSRNLAFQKRKISLKKKIKELSTLCGVKAIMMIYGPKQASEQDNQPDIWPENHTEVLEVIKNYKVQPRDERKKKTSVLSNFFEDRNKKAQDALRKLRNSKVQAKYPTSDERFNNLSEEKLIDFARFLETKLGYAKKFKILKENESNNYAYNLQQQQKMWTKKRSMEFGEFNQPNKFRVTAISHQPVYNSYNSHFPTPLQMQIPLQQYRPTLDQCTIQRTDYSNNPFLVGSSNNFNATLLPKVDPNMAYSDPLAGIPQSINFLNNLMAAPSMPYFGDSMQSMAQNYTDGSMQSMAQNYTDGSMQPMSQNYVEHLVRSTSASSQMPAYSPCQKEDHKGYY
ncbi:hypothetical protein AgCh_030144 [Apium graveolens]